MSCAACSARVEKAVSQLDGIDACSVNLLTNSMGVSGSAADSEIIKAVEDAGYGASVKGAAPAAKKDGLEDTETPKLKRRFIASLIFLLALMYFSMGHSMLGLPIPFGGDHTAHALTQMLLTLIIMEINRKFFISGFRGAVHRAPNMDTLVAMGAGASFLWSVFTLYGISSAQAAGNSDRAMELMHELYFESAGMILTLITLGKTLEAYSKGRTTDALKGLMKLAPDTAVVIREGRETTVPAAQVVKGDIFVVRPGENIPADGIVTEGETAVNEAALTGESIPAGIGSHNEYQRIYQM